MLRFLISLLIMCAVIAPSLTSGEESSYCSEEYYAKVSLLYRNRNSDTAEIIFQILSCNDQISKDSKRGQFVALVGGYMRENPSLIDHLLESASSSKSPDAAKIFLDGLWLCSTEKCHNKLTKLPFQLSIQDVNNLLQNPPPDPFLIPIEDPETLDFLWGYFFGTGDTKIVERIYDLLKDNWEALNSEDPMGTNKRLVLSAARWSLTSIAAQQGLVKNVLKNKNSPVARALLEEAKR